MEKTSEFTEWLDGQQTLLLDRIWLNATDSYQQKASSLDALKQALKKATSDCETATDLVENAAPKVVSRYQDLVDGVHEKMEDLEQHLKTHQEFDHLAQQMEDQLALAAASAASVEQSAPTHGAELMAHYDQLKQMDLTAVPLEKLQSLSELLIEDDYERDSSALGQRGGCVTPSALSVGDLGAVAVGRHGGEGGAHQSV